MLNDMNSASQYWWDDNKQKRDRLYGLLFYVLSYFFLSLTREHHHVGLYG